MPIVHQVILADDHVQNREGVKAMLSEYPAFAVVGEAADGRELLELLERGPSPEVIILDVCMPCPGGLELIREVRRLRSDIRLLVLTMYKDEDLLCQAFIEGVDGYMLKDDWSRELLPALDAVLSGRAYVSSSLARVVDNVWLKVLVARKTSPSFETLSSGEVAILKLLAQGESNEEIAHTLGMTTLAVDDHRSSILAKLHLEGWPNLTS